MSSDEKEIIEYYTLAAIEFAVQTHTAAYRANSVVTAKARGLVKGAQAVAASALEIRFHLMQAQLTSFKAGAATWAAETKFREMANDEEIDKLHEAKNNAVAQIYSEADRNDAEAMLRANCLKAQCEIDIKPGTKLAEQYENYVNGDLKKLDFGEPSSQSEALDAVQMAVTAAAAAQYDYELALALSYEADKNAELYALAAWASRGERGLRKAAQAGARPVVVKSKPNALVLLNAIDNPYAYWNRFASVAGLNRKLTDEIMEYCHEEAMSKHTLDQDTRDFAFKVLFQETARKNGKSIEDTEEIFYQGLAAYCK